MNEDRGRLSADDDVAPADPRLLAALRGVWERHDPVPPGLVDAVLARITGTALDDELELLLLVDSTERLAGVRGASPTRTLTFRSGDVTAVLRITPREDGRRRVDAWVAPPGVYDVRLVVDDEETTATSTPTGRVELAAARSGAAVLRLAPHDASSGPALTRPPSTSGRPLRTPPFPL